MINADDFIDAMRSAGFTLFAGVPCSYLTPFINGVMARDDLRYISAANEGDAVAIAAGSSLGGAPGVAMMQNSGLGNAVSPLASLTHVFEIPVLLIVTLRGDPELNDEPQHQLMGSITESLLQMLQIPTEPFPSSTEAIAGVVERATRFMRASRRPYALVMRKGAVARSSTAPPVLAGHHPPRSPRPARSSAPDRPTRAQVLRRVLAHTQSPTTVVIATTGHTGRELFALDDRPNQFYMVGSMGCASSLGLGLALARPDIRVVVIDGDGAALMRMGNMATIGAYAGPNFVHVLLDNEAHDSTGSQATVSSRMSLAGVAEACGYALVLEGSHPDLIDDLFAAQDIPGPRLAHIKTRCGTMPDLPRPDLGPVQVRQRLMQFIGTASASATTSLAHHPAEAAKAH